MKKEIIRTKNAPEAIGPYSQAVRSGGFVFVSGQIPIDPATGEMVSGTIEEETIRVLENIKATLNAAGLEMEDVVKSSIYLTNFEDFARVNEVYASFFSSDPPARATVGVAALPKGARVEIEVVAAY